MNLVKDANKDTCECCGGPAVGPNGEAPTVHEIADMDEKIQFTICNDCIYSSPRESFSSAVINTIRDLMNK